MFKQFIYFYEITNIPNDYFPEIINIFLKKLIKVLPKGHSICEKKGLKPLSQSNMPGAHI